MTDRAEVLRRHVEAAGENGWVPRTGQSVGRETEHETPRHVREQGWWTAPTYRCFETLTFTMRGDRTPRVVYHVDTRPWIGARFTNISYRRALELLAQPISDSDVHTNH